MKLVWHIFLKDVRRLWVALTLWVTLLIAKVVLGFSVFAPAASDGAWFERMQLAHGVLAGVETVTCFLIAAALVLDDSLVGSTMFWATRPIDGRRLLAAKLVAVVLLFFIAPVLVAMPWWLACGYEVRELRSALALLLVFQAVTVVPAVVLACAVERSGRFLQVLLVVLVAVLVFMMTKVARPRADVLAVPLTLQETRFWLGLFGGIAAAAGTVWMQFRTRRTPRSVVYLVVMIVLTLWANAAWPWDVARYWRESRSAEFPPAASVRATLRGVRVQEAPYSNGELRTVKFEFELQALPERYSLSSVRAEVALRWAPDDEHRQVARMSVPWARRLDATTLNLPQPTWSQDAETRAHVQEMVQRGADMRRTRRAEFSQQAPESKTVYGAEMIVSQELARRIEETPPAFDIVLQLGFERPEVIAEAPLTVGETTVGRGIRMQIIADRADGGNFAQAKSRDLVVVFARPLLDAVPAFCVVQRQTGFIGDLSSRMSFSSALPSRWSFSRTSFSFQPPKVWRADRWAPIPGSESPYSMLAVVFRWAGHAERDFHGDRLPVVSGAPK